MIIAIRSEPTIFMKLPNNMLLTIAPKLHLLLVVPHHAPEIIPLENCILTVLLEYLCICDNFNIWTVLLEYLNLQPLFLLQVAVNFTVFICFTNII